MQMERRDREEVSTMYQNGEKQKDMAKGWEGLCPTMRQFEPDRLVHKSTHILRCSYYSLSTAIQNKSDLL